jgi:aspartate/methionine/tyrosine aminotransferase
VLTSPSNPLGWVADVAEQRRLLELCRDRNLWLLADEVYERIYYGGATIGDSTPSILRLCDRDDAVHVVQSFSKSYCMTGWRVGWLVTRADLGPKLAQLNEFFVSHAATFAQNCGAGGARRGRGGASPPRRSFAAWSRGTKLIGISVWPR